jgi:multidrug resistance efflux pump
MDQLPVIPTPAGQKFREFRIRFLPIVVFACTLVAIAYIWREHVTPPNLVAHVEPVNTYVRAAGDCLVTNLLVEIYQPVRKGDTIAEVIVTDSRRLDADFQMLRSQLSLVQLELGALVDRDRLALDYYGMRNDYQNELRLLKEAQAELPQAQYNVTLASNLLGGGLVSEFDYQTYLSRFALLKADIEHLTNSISEFERNLEQMKPLALGVTQTNSTRQLRDLLTDLEERRKALEAMTSTPVTLTSPIDGVVTGIHARPGENVIGGEPVVTISASESDRIVGYMRQPLAVQPQTGMPCEIRTRSWKRLKSEGIITAVGAQFEVITNLALLRPDQMPDIGLPVAISMPPALKPHLRPGEAVDITVREK